MGYFANGTEGELYEARYCSRCLHGRQDSRPCAIWGAHLVYNYDQNHKEDVSALLGMLIPTIGIDNGECEMFIEDKKG